MADEESQKVTIDDKEYDPDNLSDTAKGQIVNLQVVDQEIASLQQKLAIAQTARNAYATALKEELPEEE
jgi:hypothetical protein